jgi:hypothetical protein
MYGRLTGSYPETGFGEINGDVLEADLRPRTTACLPLIQTQPALRRLIAPVVSADANLA